MTLTKNDLLFKRNDNGKLISREVVLETLPNKPTIVIRPLTRGQLSEVNSRATSDDDKIKASADNYIIKQGLDIDLTDEDLELMVPQMASAIVTAIFSISIGMEQTEIVSQAKEKILTEAEEVLKKK